MGQKEFNRVEPKREESIFRRVGSRFYQDPSPVLFPSSRGEKRSFDKAFDIDCRPLVDRGMEMGLPNPKFRNEKSLCCRPRFSKNQIIKCGGQVRRRDIEFAQEGLRPPRLGEKGVRANLDGFIKAVSYRRFSLPTHTVPSSAC